MTARSVTPVLAVTRDPGDDLAKLSELTEQVMRVHLQQRYSQDKIYVSTQTLI